MATATRPGAPLTARERETAALVAKGLTSRQIAARLSISERTVHAHLRAAFVKTGSRSRVMLALWIEAGTGPGSGRGGLADAPQDGLG